jgi:hypothetical protein
MENQIEALEMYFKRCEIQCEDEDTTADSTLIEGEYWEFIEPERVEAWSLHMIPFINKICFSYKFKNAQVFLQLTYHEVIKEVEADTHPMVKIKCMTDIPGTRLKDQYHFAICLNSVQIPFQLSDFLTSLEPTPYCSEIKELEAKLDNNEWKNANGTPLTWKKLCSRIRLLFNDFHTLKGKIESHIELNTPRSVSLEIMNQGVSQSSKLIVKHESGTSRGERKSQKPAQKPQQQRKGKKAEASTTAQKVSADDADVSEVAEAGFSEQIANVPHLRATERKPDYKHVSQVYQKFWKTCTDAYVFKVGDKKEIDISQMVEAPATYNIRSKQTNIVEDLVNYLLNIPDKSTKQTLCVMPVGHETMPKTWEDIEKGNFYIINGQHSVEASKFILDDNNKIDEQEREHFRKWNCFVV